MPRKRNKNKNEPTEEVKGEAVARSPPIAPGKAKNNTIDARVSFVIFFIINQLFA